MSGVRNPTRTKLTRKSKKYSNHQGYTLDSFAENVIDPVGSGDALLAYSTLTLLSTSNLLSASIIGSLAAACACEKDGNLTVTIEEVLKKIDQIEKKINFVWKKMQLLLVQELRGLKD